MACGNNGKLVTITYTAKMTYKIAIIGTISPAALATAFMVMGLEEAEAFCKADTTIDAYFIYSGENGEFKTFYTEGMKKYIAK